MITLMLVIAILIVVVAVIFVVRICNTMEVQLNIPYKKGITGKVIVELKELSALWVDMVPQKDEEKIIPEKPAVVPLQTDQPIEQHDWYNTDKFIHYLVACINAEINICKGNSFNAFSFKGVVYLTPAALSSYVFDYVKANNIKGVKEGENKHKTLVNIAGALSLRGYVKQGDVKDGYYGATYIIVANKEDSKLKKKAFYLPLVADCFVTDKLRDGVLLDIMDISLQQKQEDHDG